MTATNDPPRPQAARALLQTWLPQGDRKTVAGVVLAVLESFPHVRVFQSIEGEGFHITASEEPLPTLTPAQLVSRMPEAAVRDMTEWIQAPPRAVLPAHDLARVRGGLVAIGGRRDVTLAISHDRPVNEFYLVRRYVSPGGASPSSEGLEPRGAAVPR